MNNKILTKYERARVIGTRALQLSNGAVPMVNVDGITNVLTIAEKELMEYKMPIIIKRKMPDGTIISLKVSEMILD
jgi:DNA-directed RNA polymerase I, II, and III subunit RPABC2